MSQHENLDLMGEQSFQHLLEGVTDLQSRACDVGFERRDKQTCIYEEECEKSRKDPNEEENLKIIKQTSDIARLAMHLIAHGLQLGATWATQKSKCFNSLSSAVSFLRGREGSYQVPKHLLLEWERNMILMDLFINNEGLYCSKPIAQDMFDICMDTFDWLRSFSNNNK